MEPFDRYLNTERPEEIWLEVTGKPVDPEKWDFFEHYKNDLKYTNAIEKDFKDWWFWMEDSFIKLG